MRRKTDHPLSKEINKETETQLTFCEVELVMLNIKMIIIHDMKMWPTVARHEQKRKHGALNFLMRYLDRARPYFAYCESERRWKRKWYKP